MKHPFLRIILTSPKHVPLCRSITSTNHFCSSPLSISLSLSLSLISVRSLPPSSHALVAAFENGTISFGYRQQGYPTFESNVPFVLRYMIDNGSLSLSLSLYPSIHVISRSLFLFVPDWLQVCPADAG
jgi:DNA polymerase elongation subunit (family B)